MPSPHPSPTQGTDPVVRVRGLGKAWPGLGRPVLDGLDLDVLPGVLVAVTGASGAGKSTLLAVLAALVRPDAGEVRVAGIDVAAVDDEGGAWLRATRVGMLFQEARLVPRLSAVENAALPLLLAGVSPASALARAGALMDRVGLAGRAQAPASRLSGGEAHRVALARALVHRPALVLGDEPTGSLDRRSAEAVVALLREAGKRDGTACVIATHDEKLAAAADLAFVLRTGRLVPLGLEGPAAVESAAEPALPG